MWYVAGFLTPFALFGLAALVGWLTSTGYQTSCRRHPWSTGPMSTPRWRRIIRTRWHFLRWHSFGQQPLAAPDRWIVDHPDLVSQTRRGRRGLAMARRALDQ